LVAALGADVGVVVADEATAEALHAVGETLGLEETSNATTLIAAS
jgi:hypothetical protein